MGKNKRGPHPTPSSTSPKSWVGERYSRDRGGGRVRGPSRMTATQFELLKCRRELLSSPFRVTVHEGKGPVILLSPPHSELPSYSKIPPDGAAAPLERPANSAGGATWGQSCGQQLRKQQRVQASHGMRQACLNSLSLSQASTRKGVKTQKKSPEGPQRMMRRRHGMNRKIQKAIVSGGALERSK